MKTLLSSLLFRKLLGIVVACLLVSQITMTLTSIHRLKAKYLNSFQFNARAVAVQFEELILDTLDWGGDIYEVGRQDVPRMDMLFSHPQFEKILTRIAVTDAEGRVLGHANHSQIPPLLSKNTLQQLQSARGQIVSIRDGRSYDTYVPIVHSDVLQGFILVGFEGDLIDQVIRDDIYGMILENIVLTCGFFLIFVVGFILGVNHNVIRPLNNMIQKIQYIQKSADMSVRVEVYSEDEIGMLAVRFNQMMEVMQRAKVTLQGMLQQYEGQVDEEQKAHGLLAETVFHAHQVSNQLCFVMDGNEWDDVVALESVSRPLINALEQTDSLYTRNKQVVCTSDSEIPARTENLNNIIEIAENMLCLARELPGIMKDWFSFHEGVLELDKHQMAIQKLQARNRHLTLTMSMSSHSLAGKVMGRKKVLVVGWDKLERGILERVLAFQYFDVQVVPDAIRCLELLMPLDFQPDIIVMETVLPGMNGVVLASKIRKMPAYQIVPILFISESGDFHAQAKSIPFSGFILGRPRFETLDSYLWQMLIYYHYTSSDGIVES